MKWIHEPKPKLHDTKIVHKFLYLPVTLDNETRWWQYDYIVYSYGYHGSMENYQNKTYFWKPIHWYDNLERIKQEAKNQIIENRLLAEKIRKYIRENL